MPDGFGSWSRRVVVAMLLNGPIYVIAAWALDHWTSTGLGLRVVVGSSTILTAPSVFELTRLRDSERGRRRDRALRFLFLAVEVSSLAVICLFEEGTYRWLSAMGVGVIFVFEMQRQWVQDWMHAKSTEWCPLISRFVLPPFASRTSRGACDRGA